MLQKIYTLCLALFFPASAKERLVEGVACVPMDMQLRATRAGGEVLSLASLGEPAVRAAVHTLKYKGNARAARLLAHMLHDALMEYASDAHMFGGALPVLAPVPLFAARERERGFNQVTRVLDELARVAPEWQEQIHADMLVRTKDTHTQTKLTRAARLKNVEGAFALSTDTNAARRAAALPAAHARYIIIDDVVTTGATLTECERALTSAGIPKANITLLALARA